jgi:acid stress-induced BolA-like protein IbaG/YrbA
MSALALEIKSVIQTLLPDAEILVADPDGHHFEAIVISDTFIGQPLVKQHQLIMNGLKEQFKEKVHALALKTFTKEKWALQKHLYHT